GALRRIFPTTLWTNSKSSGAGGAAAGFQRPVAKAPPPVRVATSHLGIGPRRLAPLHGRRRINLPTGFLAADCGSRSSDREAAMERTGYVDGKFFGGYFRLGGGLRYSRCLLSSQFDGSDGAEEFPSFRHRRHRRQFAPHDTAWRCRQPQGATAEIFRF